MTDKSKAPELIVIRERLPESLAKDAGTVIAAISLIAPGAMLESVALQTIGCLIFVAFIVSRAIALIKRNTYTLDEAKARIDAMIAERGRQ